MKNRVLVSFLVLVLVLIALLFSSCSAKQQAIVENEEYSALLYANSAGSNVDSTTMRYIGERFYTVSDYLKPNMEDKTFSLLDKDYSVLYLFTMKDSEQPYDLDLYMSASDSGKPTICCRSDTGGILRFQAQPSYSSAFPSPVNCESTDEEFLAYASEVLAEYAGVSTKGWDTEIVRSKIKWQTEEGFFHLVDGRLVSVSESEYEELADSTIHITYTKKIGEIKRSDQMRIQMTNAGEIIEYKADNYEDAFAPFKDVQPDKQKILHAVAQVSSKGISSSVDEVLLTPHNGSLWAEVRVVYRSAPSVYDDTVVTSGASYVVEIAHLK